MHIRRTIIRHKYQLYGTKVCVLIIENLPEYIIENLSTKSVDNFMDNLAINTM